MSNKKRFSWFKKNYEHKLVKYPEIKISSEKDGDFGSLEGIGFNNENQGGYLYFWENNFVGFQIVDYIAGEEIIEDTLLDIKNDDELLTKLTPFIEKL